MLPFCLSKKVQPTCGINLVGCNILIIDGSVTFFAWCRPDVRDERLYAAQLSPHAQFLPSHWKPAFLLTL